MSKKVFIVMVVLALTIAFVPIIIVLLYDETSNTPNDTSANSAVLPTLELKLNTEENNQTELIITANAKTQDSSGISSITLPDGSTINSASATYTVTKNGNYSFSATSNNGQSVSEEITVSNIIEYSSSTPYIPDKFSFSTGEPENGYTIIDDFKNEYVWVPVPDGKLIRNTEDNKNYQENDVTVTELIRSVKQYSGFYIAKYESSKYTASGTAVAATIQNQKPWTHVIYSTAEKAAVSSATTFGYLDSKTAIVNSYAWDSTLAWINSTVDNYSSNTSFGNYSGEVNLTGNTVTDTINHICDMAGNVSEWSTENYKENTSNMVYKVTRGGHFNLSRTAHSHNNNNELVPDNTLGFRMILYKTN